MMTEALTTISKLVIIALMIRLLYFTESWIFEEKIEACCGRFVSKLLFNCALGYMILNLWLVLGFEVTEFLRLIKHLCTIGILVAVFFYAKQLSIDNIKDQEEKLKPKP